MRIAVIISSAEVSPFQEPQYFAMNLAVYSVSLSLGLLIIDATESDSFAIRCSFSSILILRSKGQYMEVSPDEGVELYIAYGFK